MLPAFPASLLPGQSANVTDDLIYHNYAVTKGYVDAGLSATNLTAILSKSTDFITTINTVVNGVTAIPGIPTSNFSGKVLAINNKGTALEWSDSALPQMSPVGAYDVTWIKYPNNLITITGRIARNQFVLSGKTYSNNIKSWECNIAMPNSFNLQIPYTVHSTFTPNPTVQTTSGFVGSMNCYITNMGSNIFTLGILCNPSSIDSDYIAFTVTGVVTSA